MQLQSPVPFGLSPREAQVLGWVAQGKTNKEIGVILELSPRTVQKHLEHIYRKIYVESRTAAAAKAYEVASLAGNQTNFPKSFLLEKAKFMLRPSAFAQDRPAQDKQQIPCQLKDLPFRLSKKRRLCEPLTRAKASW
jgi:DNA-binding CsgD family transcriptional regulator